MLQMVLSLSGHSATKKTSMSAKEVMNQCWYARLRNFLTEQELHAERQAFLPEKPFAFLPLSSLLGSSELGNNLPVFPRNIGFNYLVRLPRPQNNFKNAYL